MIRVSIEGGIPLNFWYIREYGFKEGIILSVLSIWQRKSDDGWCILPEEEIGKLGISPDQFRTAKEKLIIRGILEEKNIDENTKALRVRK
jgi:hypothetical protein